MTFLSLASATHGTGQLHKLLQLLKQHVIVTNSACAAEGSLISISRTQWSSALNISRWQQQ
jgi:hypothetical protein